MPVLICGYSFSWRLYIYLSPSLSLSISPSIYISIYLSFFIHLSFSLPISVYLPISLSIYLSHCLFIYLSLYIYPSILNYNSYYLTMVALHCVSNGCPVFTHSSQKRCRLCRAVAISRMFCSKCFFRCGHWAKISSSFWLPHKKSTTTCVNMCGILKIITSSSAFPGRLLKTATTPF